MTGLREQQMIEAANLLLDARRTHTPIADLPPELQPTSTEECGRVHDEMALAYEDIGGWKIGAGAPDATPFFAPMPRAWMAKSIRVVVPPKAAAHVVQCGVAFGGALSTDA